MFSQGRKLLEFYCHCHQRQYRKFLISITVWTFSLVVFICVVKAFGLCIESYKNTGSSGSEFHYLEDSQEASDYGSTLDNSWTRISDSVHVYSAHLDTRPTATGMIMNLQKEKNNNKSVNEYLSLIRIIGMKRVPSIRDVIRVNPMKWLRLKDETYYGDKYFCKIFVQSLQGNLPMESFKGEFMTYQIIEEGVKRFAGCYFNCYVNSTKLSQAILQESLIFVAIYPVNISDYPDKLLRVENHMLIPPGKNVSSSVSNSIAICVRPLFGPMDDLIKVVQFVSYYHAMGVSFFNFYDLSISPRIRKYLTRKKLLRNKALSTQGVISVNLKTWNLPTGNTSELWDYGSLAALNDCLYRNMQSNHVIFVDIDEFIVPQMEKHVDLHDVINFYEKVSSNFHQLRIRNTFFCEEFCRNSKNKRDSNNATKYDSGSMQIKNSLLPISRCLLRTKRVWNVNLRSKFILKPRKVISVGHHLVTKFWGQVVDHRFNRNTIEAQVDVALLNHYRECESITTKKHPVLNRLTVEDKKILRFVKKDL